MYENNLGDGPISSDRPNQKQQQRCRSKKSQRKEGDTEVELAKEKGR